MEFILNTDLEKSLPAQIDFNHEQLKSELSKNLETYKALVVTEDSIKEGKAKRATLNNLKKALDSQRTSVKNQCLAPYLSFESKIKELTGMVDEAVSHIDRQVKAFDEAKKEEKRVSIELFFNTNVGDLRDLVTLEQLWNDRWMNVSYKLIDITQEIVSALTKATNDIGIIKAMKTDCEQQMLDAYLKTLDMSTALAEKTRFEERQKQLEEYEAKQAATIVRTTDTGVEELTGEKAKLAHKVFKSFSQDNAVDVEYSEVKEETKTIKVIFYDTTTAFRADMKALTEKHSIKYGGIK